MSPRIKAVLLAGLIVGTVDITAACVAAYAQHGVTPDGVLKFVAMGALGPEARQGGAGTAAAGLFFHSLIALYWTAVFFFVYPKLPAWREKLFAGFAYGLFVWAAMTFVVVPLSRVPARPFNLQAQLPQIFIHAVLIGGAISLLTKRHYGDPR